MTYFGIEGGASSCITCRRRLPRSFRERADGETTQPALPDEWCRYCSRPLSEMAVEIEESLARPRQRDEAIVYYRENTALAQGS